MSQSNDETDSIIPSLEIAAKRRFESIPHHLLNSFCKRLSQELQDSSITPTTVYQLIYDIVSFQNSAWASKKSFPGVPCKIPLSLLLSFDSNSALEAILKHLLFEGHIGTPKIDEETYSSVCGLVLQPPYFTFPKIHVSNECSDKVQLEIIARKYGATIVDLSAATHLVVPPSSAETQSALGRPLELNETTRSVLVHFHGKPSSNDAWISETNLQNFSGPILPLPTLPAPIPVSSRFIIDMENYSEWLCEYDYFEGPLGQFDYFPVILSSRSKKRSHDEILNSKDEDIEPKKLKLENDEPYQLREEGRRHEYRTLLGNGSHPGISGAYGVLTQPSLDKVGGPSARGEMTSVGPTFSNSKELGPQPSLVLPPHCEWFHMNEIHERERKALPEFFEERAARSSNKSAEIYREYRDFMIHTYQQNPSQYLTYTSCRRSLAGDACAVLRVFDFLESCGLINYACSSDIHGIFPSPAPVPPPSELAQHHLKVDNPGLPAGLVSHHSNADHAQLPSAMAVESGMAFQMGLRDFSKYPSPQMSDGRSTQPATKIPLVCARCNQSIAHLAFVQSSKGGSVKNPEKICRDCFSRGQHSYEASEYQLIDNRVEMVSNEDKKPWSDSETLCLLDALEQFGDDWDKVAQYVGSRDKHACLLHFLRLPIDDPFVPQHSSAPSNHENKNYLPSPNPILHLVSFLSHTVSPKVAAAASQAAIKTFIAENFKSKEKSKLVPTPSLPTAPLPSQNMNGQKMDVDSQNDALNGVGPSHEAGKDEEEEIQNLTSIASAGLSAAVLKSILLAEKEERDIRMITHQVVDATIKKLELKMKYFDELEHFLQEEHKKLELTRIRILDEKWHLEKEKRSVNDMKLQIEKQAQQQQQMGLGS
jgi:SWI/SNF related-matrix-associated actin-dependent regulator of chromatin subfamily C